MSSTRTQELGLAVAGIVLTGAAVGLPHGPDAILAGAVGLPALLSVVILTTVPAFVIGAAYLGATPDTRAVLNATASGVRGGGVYLLGLLPALAFLLATARRGEDRALLATAALSAGAAVGLATMYQTLAARGTNRQLVELFLVWVVVAAGIGAILYFRHLPS